MQDCRRQLGLGHRPLKALCRCHFFLSVVFSTMWLLSLTACSSDPRWVDEEAHEKTELLQKQYTPLIAGTWHLEHIAERVRYFERLTFLADGKLSGMRKWQTRRPVTINGEERFTDWENQELLSGTFQGTWQLHWERDEQGVGHDKIILYATFDDEAKDFVAYSSNLCFNLVGEDILRLMGNGFVKSPDGWTEYQRGYAEPNF